MAQQACMVALDTQLDLIRWTHTTECFEICRWLIRPDRNVKDWEAKSDEGARNWAEGMREGLNLAATYWVSLDMYRLTRHVAERLTVPTDLSAMPSPHGFVYLNRPHGSSQEEQETILAMNRGEVATDMKAIASELTNIIHAFSWHRYGDHVRACFYRWQSFDGKSILLPSEGTTEAGPIRLMLSCGTSLVAGAELEPDDFHNRLVVGFWLLCGQKLVRQHNAPLDRHTSRRAARANLPNEEGVKVVMLRREEKRAQVSEAHRTVEWSHRWIVSGHTRNQWYASLGMHLPITIEPYEKGPEGAPLIVRDTIYKVDR